MSKMSFEVRDVRVERRRLVRQALHGPTMGTRYSAVFYAPPSLDPAKLESALRTAVDRVDNQMSNWKPKSDVNRLNAAQIAEWMILPEELLTVLECATRIEAASGGAFDAGVGAHVLAYGFGPSGAPDPECIARLGSVPPTRRAIEIDRALGRARKIAPLTLDLSGIAKGFGVDELGRAMEAFGIDRYLVGIDGELRAGKCKPDGSAWVVAHERPAIGRREPMGVIELVNRAVATSGTYRHLRQLCDRTISHTIDPRTGVPLKNEIASVTTLADTCIEADAWATAIMVLGTEAGLAMARDRGLNVVVVQENGQVRSTLDDHD